MNCPTCGKPLVRTTYEGVSLHECPQCAGYLVGRGRLVLIRSSREQSTGALEAEAARGRRADDREEIRCPRCRARTMREERIPVEDDAFTVDVCDDCDLVWFDGGELARMQLHHEESAQALEAYAFRQRAHGRTADETAELEQRVESLPRSTSGLHGAAHELLLITATIALFMLTVGSLLVASRAWTAGFSVAFAACLAWLIVRRLGGTQSQLTAITAAAFAELLFLLLLFNVW